MSCTITSDRKLSVAVIGVGYLGKFHAEKYASSAECDLYAVVDSDAGTGQKVALACGTQFISDYKSVVNDVDAVSIATTISHYEIAKYCLLNRVHVLVEKPVTVSVEEADELVSIAERNNCTLQVGHLQRFHPALLELDKTLMNPVFIETHRLAPFNLRGTDVNVVLNLMIHDIDTVLNLVDSEVESISASGAKILSDSIDIANVRLNFANGCVANITASRVSQKTKRKMRIFQKHKYLSIDLYKHCVNSHFRDEVKGDDNSPEILSEVVNYENNDALLVQIQAFIQCVKMGKRPLVSGIDGRRALATAIEITRHIDAASNNK